MGTTETSRQVGGTVARGEAFHVRAGYRRSRIVSHLWKTTALTTLALGLSGVVAHADPDGLWQPQIRAIVGADNNGGNAALEGFIPIKQTAESVLFLDVRAKHDFKDASGQDIGLGIRRIVNPDLMLGGYAYINLENYNSTQFTAATLGVEAITPNFDAHVNVFAPIKGDSTDHSTSSTLSMVSNQLIEQISVLDHRDYAAWGIEGEIGAQVPVNLPDKHSLRLDIGGYHFEDPHGDDGSVTGAKAGFEYTIGDVFGSGTELVFAGEVRNDNRDDTQFAGSVRLNIPFNPGHSSDRTAAIGTEPVYPVSEGLRKRVNERVRGDIGVRIQSQEVNGGSTTRVAINAATNAAFGKFYFADGGLAGAGTLTDPTTLDDAVTKAGSGGFVVALGGNGNLTTAGVTLANGQTVIGGGESVTAKLFGGGSATFNLGGSDGTIQGTNVANNVITLGTGNTLNGITITGGANGIFGNNASGTTLTNLTVTGAGGNGAAFTGNSTNVSASNFTATGNGLDGLHIEDNGTYNFTGTTLLQGNHDDGLDISGQGTYTFAAVNALDNTDRGITVQGTSVAGSFTTTGGTVSGNGGTAVFIDPIIAHVVLDSISQAGGTSGVVLDHVSGSFTVNGATTISNTTGPAIAISDSPAAIRFGDINITNPGGDGMSFSGVNAAVVAGNIVISGLGVGTGLDFSGSRTNFTAQSLNITGTGAAGTIGIDLSSPTSGGATIVVTDGGAIAGVDTGVRFGIAGSLANSANAEFSFGGGSIAGITASLDARGLNQTLGHYAFGSTTFSGPQLFDTQNVIFVGASATGTGTGSSLLDLASIATADANTDADAIFVLVNRGTAIDDTDGFSLTAGQTLASFGNGRTFSLGGIPVNVTGDNISHTSAVSDAGGAATLTSSAGADTVTLANNSSLLDFNVSNANPGGTGIHGNNVTGVTINGVNVSGAGLYGLLFEGASNVAANNVTSTGNASDGLHIEGDGNYAFTGTTTLSDNGGNGLFIAGDGTYAFQTLNASDNSGFGVNVLSTTGTFSTTDGIISGNGAAGVALLGANIDVTLTSLTQDGGLFGATFAGVSGNFAVSGATTVSNTLLGGVGIFDSTADFTFGAVDISDITAPGGIGIDVQNSGGAVTFGGPVTLTHIDSEGILAIDNAGTLTFSGPVSLTDPGDGIWLEDNTGAVSFNGAVTIDQPFGNGIDVVGSNGIISFGDIDITGLCNCATALDLSGSTSTFTAARLDVSGSSGGSSIGIDLSGTNGGSVTIGSGVITGVDTGVQMGTNGLAGTTANTTFSFGAAGGASITGTTASLDMRGLNPGSGTYAFNGTVLNGPQLFDTANVIYVGATSTGLGDGSDANNLINAAAADKLTTAANTIFVLVKTAAVQTADTDADGFTLANGQSLVSFANGGTVTLGGPPANVTGANVVTGATQADPFGFGGATINNAAGNTIDLANGNLVKNLSVSSSNFAIDGSGSNGATIDGVTISAATIGLLLDGTTGIVNVNKLSIQSASQTGIALVGSSATVNFTGNTTIANATNVALFANNFDGTASFNDLDITGGGTGVAVLAGSSGTLTFGSGSSIAGTSSDAFSIGNSSAHVSYAGTINQTSAARAVRVSFLTGGTATFGGKITASTGAVNAIELTGNTGSTINFTGGLDLTTDGGYGFRAINGGTLTVTGSSNTVATGAGLDEKGILIGGTGMTIGAAGVNFSSVTVDGSGGIVSSGIVIENTSGGNVTFGAVDINRVNGDAIRLTNVSGIYTFNGTTKIDTVVGGGPGFVVQNSAATVNVGKLATTLVSGADVNLTNNTGTIGIGGTITNSGSGDGIVVSGGSAAITVSANVSSSASAPGTAVRVDGTTGGSVHFGGAVTSTGTGSLFDIGSTTAPTGGAINFTGAALTATGGGNVVIGGLGAGATFNASAPLSITNAAANGLSISNVAGSASFGAVTVSGSGGNGIDISGNTGAVTLGTTNVTLGAAANTAGINFGGTNADVSFGSTTIDNVGANQTGIDFSGSATTADFGLTTITGLGALTSRGIDLSTTTGNKVITFLQGSKIDDLGVGVELSSGGTTATSANATFTFGDGDSTDGLESFIIAAPGGFTLNTIGLDPTLGIYDFDDVFFTGNAHLVAAPGAVTMVSQSGGSIAAGTFGLNQTVNTISLAAADALAGAQTFAFVGTINLGGSAFTLDSGQVITGFGNGNVVSTGTIQPVNVLGNIGATGGNITANEAVVTGTGDFMHLLGDNAVRNTAFNFSGATGSTFLVDQGAGGFSNAGGITIEGVTISNVAAGQTAVKVLGLDSNLAIINNNINVAGKLLDVSGGTGTISVSRGFLPNGGPAGTLTGGGIAIAGRTGGAVDFTDQVTINGGGVAISGGSGAAAVNFNGGLDITTSSAIGLDFSGLNVLTIANAGSTTINATGQTALSLQGTLGAGGVNLDSVTSTNAAAQGVLISGASGGGVDLDAVNVTASGGAGIEVLNSTGSSYTFGNTTINNSATAGRGVNIENAAGVTSATFDGTLAITTSTGTGLRVVGGASPANTSVSFTGGAKSISTSSGTAVDINSANVNGTFASTSATFSAGNGINLQNLTGTLDLGTGTLTNTGSGAAFNVGSAANASGGNATISYAGTIASAGLGAAVSIQELTGGSVTLSGNLSDSDAAGGGNILVANINNGTAATVTFSGLSKQISSGATDAVSLTGNPDATIDLSGGGLAITTTSGAGFVASGAGTVGVAGSGNTITTTTGTALNLNGVTVGTGGVNFGSVSTNGAVNGILLNNVASSGGGAIALGTVNLQGITSRGVDVSGTLDAALSFNDLDIGLNSSSTVAVRLAGATINAAVTANDFDVTNSAAAGSSIGVDLRGATGGQTVRLGDAVIGGASSSISGVNTGVFLNSTTNLAFIYGDGESAIDQNSTISANVGIDATSAPVAGTYNFKDVNFQANPGNGFGLGTVYFVGATATGDGTGRDQNNLATLSTAEAAAISTDILVLVNDGGTITAAGSNADNTLTLATGEQVRGFGNGNINLALTVPSTIQLASTNISIADATPNGAATLTTNAGGNVITLGASGNIIDGFILDGSPAGAARGIKDNGGGASGTTISHMTISNFTAAGVEITPSTSTTIDNVTFSGNATDVIVNALNTTISNVTSTGATGIAFDIRNTTGTTTLSNLTVTTAATGTGIAFGGGTGPQGTINASNVDISGGSGVSVSGGNAAITFDAASSITSTSGTAVNISTRGGGSFGFAGTVVANGVANGLSVAGATAANTVSFTGTVDFGSSLVLTGTAVSINNNATASTVSFSNIDIATNGTTGFSASNGGTVNVTTGTVSSTGAQAVGLNGVAAGVTFASTNSSGGANNVNLTNVTGTVALGSGALTGAAGTSFNVSGGSATVGYAGTISQTTASQRMIAIADTTGGAINFTTAVANGLNNSAATGTGILIDGAAGNVTINNASLTGARGITILGDAGNNATGTFTFNNVAIQTAAGAANHAFVIDGDQGLPPNNDVNATVNLNNVDITNPGGNVVNIQGMKGGSVTFDSASTITRTDNGLGILATSNLAGTITFGGATKTLTTGGNNAVNLTNNGGTTINFTNGGLAINTTNGTGFNATSGGTVSVTGGTNSITTTSGVAVNLDTVVAAAAGVNFATTTKGAGGSSAVIMDTVTGTGTVSLGGGSLVGGSGATIRFGDGLGTANSGGTAGLTYTGTITSGNVQAIDIQDRAAGAQNITLSGNIIHSVSGQTGIFLDGNAAGTITFSGASKSISSGASTGVNLTNNTGATIDFTGGGLVINTTSGTGFNATGGGTVTVQGSGNTITSTTGTALNVVNTAIGAGNLIFQNITSNGGSANGIILVNTGTAAGNGGLHVTGTGTVGSGGTIANKSGADGSATLGTGIFLNGTKDVQLGWMQLNDFGNFAIRGNNVTGFTLDHSVINGDSGTSNSVADALAAFANVGEDAIRLTNLLGSGSITNSNISGGYTNTVNVENNTGTLNRLTIDSSTIGGRSDNGTGMNDGIHFQADAGSTAMNLTVSNSALTSARANLVAATGGVGTNMDVKLLGNTVTNNHPLTVSGGTAFDVASLGNVTFNISSNSFDMHAANGGTGIKSHVIEVNKGSGSGSSIFDGTISGNTIGVAGTLHSGSGIGSNDIDINSQDNGTFTVAILNNILTHYDTAGIQISQLAGSSTINATVQGNTTSNGDSNAFTGLYVVAGSGLAGDNGVINLLVGGSGTQRNDFSNGDPANGSDVYLQVTPGSTSTINLSRGVSGAATAEQVIIDNNLNPGTTTVATSGTVNLVNTVPPLP